jgi:protein SCO1/2
VKNRLWLLALVVLLAAPAAATMLRRHFARPELPNLGQVPSFRFVDQSGTPFGSRELGGHVWIADFIFTSCPEICPRMSEEMARLQSALRNRGLLGPVSLVSISVDPERDTPARLAEYATRFHVDGSAWKLLTGPQHDVEEAVVRGFKIGLSHDDQSQDAFAIVHGTRFVLVDGGGAIRGYYDSGDAAAMARLRDDAQALTERK